MFRIVLKVNFLKNSGFLLNKKLKIVDFLENGRKRHLTNFPIFSDFDHFRSDNDILGSVKAILDHFETN